MIMDITQQIFPLIQQNDVAGVSDLLDQHPGLVHSRSMNKDDGRSTLQVAAAFGHLEMCRLLVDRGVEVYPNPRNQYPPVIEAAWKGHDQVVNYFLTEIPERADGTNKLGVAINLAGRQGWIEIVREHLKRDPLVVHDRGWIGDSPLHWPAHNNYADIVSLLVDAGADVEADEVNWIGGKPLHWASEHAPESVKVLLKAGANVNCRNIREDSPFYQVTPLIMNATQKDDCSEVTELLLAAGADIQAKDARGMTAMDHARKLGCTRIQQTLTQAGA